MKGNVSAEYLITGYKCSVMLGQSLLMDPAHSEFSPISLKQIRIFSTAVLPVQLERENYDPPLTLFLTN